MGADYFYETERNKKQQLVQLEAAFDTLKRLGASLCFDPDYPGGGCWEVSISYLDGGDINYHVFRADTPQEAIQKALESEA